VAPVSAPRRHQEVLGAWSVPHMGLDFGALRRFASNTIYTEHAHAWMPQLIASSQTAAVADFMTATDTHFDHTGSSVSNFDGECHGLLAWIRIRLGGSWLGTGPMDPDVHWAPQYFPVDPFLAVRCGDVIQIHLQRPEFGHWTWEVEAPEGRRRHSTFLGRPLALQELRRLSPEYAPQLNTRGQAAKDVINRLDGDLPNSQIASLLLAKYPAQFRNKQSALEFVRGIARQYAD